MCIINEQPMLRVPVLWSPHSPSQSLSLSVLGWALISGFCPFSGPFTGSLPFLCQMPCSKVGLGLSMTCARPKAKLLRAAPHLVLTTTL